ncbi:MAG: Asp-tRNA(Asn)/Glu-tRNA(Gln) amidotransferase subunit GatB [Chloroflexota bacterium]
MTSGTAAPEAAVAYEAVIGIECHVQLRTASKMFCGCSTDFQDAPPNTHCCPTCLGLPGALPVINEVAVRHVLAAGVAIGGRLLDVTRWDRKNYFYPDLPKGYQISQYDLPLVLGGSLTFDTSEGPFTVAITRAHLEEDTARLQHRREPDGRSVSLVDYNRSGTPLMEIVTDPVVRTAEQARRYAEELRLLLVTIGASDAALENGQMRVEANVSLRPVGTVAFGTRVEVKNMNSFRSVERAIAFEIDRQERALRAGEPLIQETRGWDDDRGVTYRMRIKESSDDYRYFPEPDLPPLHLSAAYLDDIRASLPELPAARRTRYAGELGLAPADATIIVADAGATALFEAALAADPALPPRKAGNWVVGEYLRLAKGEAGAAAVAGVSGAELAALVAKVEAGDISGTNAKQVFETHARTGRPVADLIAEAGFKQISDEGPLRDAIAGVLAANPAAVADVRAGKAQAIGFLTGQVMRQTRGQANAAVVGRLLREALEEA